MTSDLLKELDRQDLPVVEGLNGPRVDEKAVLDTYTEAAATIRKQQCRIVRLREALREIAMNPYVSTSGPEFSRGFNQAKEEATNMARAALEQDDEIHECDALLSKMKSDNRKLREAFEQIRKNVRKTRAALKGESYE